MVGAVIPDGITEVVFKVAETAGKTVSIIIGVIMASITAAARIAAGIIMGTIIGIMDAVDSTETAMINGIIEVPLVETTGIHFLANDELQVGWSENCFCDNHNEYISYFRRFFYLL